MKPEKKPGPIGGPAVENGRKERLLLGLGNLLNHRSGRAGFVHAEWFFGKEVSGGGEGAGATSHANMTKFTTPALPFQVVVVAEFVEDRGVGPDVGEALLAQVTGESGQIAAGEHFAFVRDEADAGTGKTAFGHGVHVAGVSAGMAGVSHGRPAAWLKRDSG